MACTFTENVMADDMDQAIIEGVKWGSAAVFGTMVAVTGALSANEVRSRPQPAPQPRGLDNDSLMDLTTTDRD